MSKTNTELDLKTNHWYGPFVGWLIIPIIVAFLDLLGAIIMVIFLNPSEINGTDLLIYYADVVVLPILIVTFIMMFLRKRFFTYLIIVYFAISAIFTIIFYRYGMKLDVFQLVMSIVWIIYFIRSERVKATFTK